MKAQAGDINLYKTLNTMKRNYELNEFHEFRCMNFAAKAANVYELSFCHSYQFATKLQNSICDNLFYSCNS